MLGRDPVAEVYRGYWHGEVAIKRFYLPNATPEQISWFKEEVRAQEGRVGWGAEQGGGVEQGGGQSRVGGRAGWGAEQDGRMGGRAGWEDGGQSRVLARTLPPNCA